MRGDERSRVEEKIREWISKARRVDDKARKISFDLLSSGVI